MATVPIEIVLQDAETPVDPTPTPESGEETNIVVPNTGTISNDGSNSGGISSTISIILPIVIAVLALGAMVALLVHRQQKRKSNINANTSKKEKFATVASGTIAILAATVLVGNLVIPATNAATSVAPGTAELETEDKITIVATREQDSDTITATVKNTSYATANLDFGYKVTASMAEGLTTANLYLDGDETSGYYISPVTDGILTDNTWGYTLEEPSEESSYLSMPLEDTPTTIVKGNGEIEDELVDIYYTIKVDKLLPAGTYTGELEYALTDNNFPSTLTTMQGMTSEICESTYTPSAFKSDGVTIEDNVPTTTLMDIRDNKTYTIAKLADGKCWMTQNLDLQKEDLVVASLDSANTDNPTNGFELPESEIGSNSWGSFSSESEINTAHVYNIQGDGKTYHSCIEYYHGSCSEYSEEEIAVSNFGNYYNWYAATAGTGTYSLDHEENANGSICPNGWRLPDGDNNNEIGYNRLLNVYGISTDHNNNALLKAPFLFVFSGQYTEGSHINGDNGQFWSSTSESTAQAYSLQLSSITGTSLDQNGKFMGLSVRCLAQ